MKADTPSKRLRDVATTVMFTDDPVSGHGPYIAAAHIMELRTAVNAMRTLAGLPAKVFTDASLAGLSPRKEHVTELRSALAEARTLLGLSSVNYRRPASNDLDLFYASDLTEIRGGVR